MTLAGLYTLAASLIWSTNTLFLLDAGLSLSEVFITNAFFSVGIVLFEIPTGIVADLFGRRTSYLASVGVLSLTTVAYLAAAAAETSVVIFSLISIALGFGFTLYSGALVAWLVDGLKSIGADTELDSVFARSQQVIAVAMLSGTLVGGFLGQVDLAIPMLVRSGLLVLLLALASRLMHDIGFAPLDRGDASLWSAMKQQGRAGIDHGWNQKALRRLMLAGAIRGGFGIWAFYAAQPYLLDLLERDAVWIIGVVVAGQAVARMIGNQILQSLRGSIARRSTLLVAGAAATSIGSIVVGVAPNFAVAVGALFAIDLVMGAANPVREAYLHSLTPTQQRATVASFDALIASGGGIGGQLGLGAVADARSLSAGYVTGAVGSMVAIPILASLRKCGDEADLLPHKAG